MKQPSLSGEKQPGFSGDSDLRPLYTHIGLMWRVGAGLFVLTLLGWVFLRGIRPDMNGLLLGELGGAYVVYSMIRQGHVKDGMEGRVLFASGMLGMFTRFIVLVAVIVVAVKTPGVNPLAALGGYLLGFALIVFGMWGYARNRRKASGESR